MSRITFFDKIHEMRTPEDLGHYLCDLMSECEDCPVRKLCRAGEVGGKNGFVEWLRMEDKEA